MEAILSLLSTYKYIILFPLAVAEGPITTITAGFLSHLGILNIFLVYIIIVSGDIVGDASLYLLGRWGSPFVHRYGPKIGLTEERLSKSKVYFYDNKKKALFFSKTLHGVGFTGLIVAGNLRIPYHKFFPICFAISIIQTLFFLAIGVFFGRAYVLIGSYLNFYDSILFIIAIFTLIYVLLKKYNIIKK